MERAAYARRTFDAEQPPLTARYASDTPGCKRARRAATCMPLTYHFQSRHDTQ